jgi:hypothetical protein
MANPTKRLATRLPLLALAGVLLLALPAGAAANSNNPITQTGGMSATLPLLGASLIVDVTLDGVGDISGVSLTPSGTLNSTGTAKDVVTFASADGKTKVTVRASGDRLAIKARSSLDNLRGKGSWSANVFGTGAASVDYTIGKDGAGNPTLAIGPITTPALVTAAKVDPKTKTFDTKDKDGGWAWAFGGVTFTHDGFVKHLSISISVRKSDGSARLAIVLSGRDRQKLTGSPTDLGGARTWSAKLCDGTAVSVKYHVASNGTLVYDGATGPGATEKAFDGKGFKFGKGAKFGDLVGAFIVRFDKSGVGVVVALFKNADGTYTLKVSGRSGFCGGKGDRGGHGGHGGWGWGWGGHGHGGDGNHKPKSKP